MRRTWPVLLALLVVSVVSALTASNIVPASKAGQSLSAIDANALKPDECAALSLTTVVVGGTGTAASELIVGTDAAETLTGAGGDDCLLAGTGDDTLDGGPATDVCLGGFGADTYDPSCETQTDSDPPGCSSPGSQTVVTTRDSFILQGSPNENKGTDTSLWVESKTGALNQRSLVYFDLPSLPAGCSVTSATLRVYNISPTSGRTIEALRLTASWTETGVTWNNQPGTAGTAATSATPSSAAWQTWTVTSHVQNMYTLGNHGFLLKDQTEDSAAAPKQNYTSREQAPNDPELIVNWG